MKKLQKLYKRTTSGAVQEWQAIVEGNKYWTVYGKQGGKQITSEPTTCVAKNVGKSNETSAEQQALLEAEADWTKKSNKHYATSIGGIDEESFYKVMLAENYHKRKDSKDGIKFPAIYQHKLDGIRYVARASGGLSRGGKPLGGAVFIDRALDPLFAKYPDTVLDGELFNPALNDNFQELVSVIKREKLSASQMDDADKIVQYHVYDCPRIAGLTEANAYTARMGRLSDIITKEFPQLMTKIKLVDHWMVHNYSDVDRMHLASVRQGYEGGILRYDIPYENKRTWNLLKIKSFNDAEFPIVEVLSGHGAKAKTAASITLSLPDGTQFNSNIKGGFEVYDQIWASRDKLVGKIATCRFFGVSEDSIPRFPYVVAIGRDSYE